MTVLLLAQSAVVAEVVARATSGQATIVPRSQWQDPTIAARELALATELVLIEAGDVPDEALAVARWSVERFGTPVVLISDDPTLGVQALRAGLRDLLPASSDVAEVHATIARHRRTAPTEAPRHGRIITVASPKGGVGKTTIATNLAVGLALSSGQPVVLVDLDLHFGDVSCALNLSPEYTLPETSRAALGGDSLALKPYLTRHETGLWVVAGTDDPAAADTVSTDQVAALLRTLASDFGFVVVDTSPGLSEHTLAALDLTTDLVLVTGLDVPGLRGLRKEIATLTELSLLVESRQVVLNFADPSRGLSVADVEATIRAGIDTRIPSAPAVPISVNQGIPLLQSQGKDKVTAQLNQLVARLIGRPEPTKRSMFARRKEPRIELLG